MNLNQQRCAHTETETHVWNSSIHPWSLGRGPGRETKEPRDEAEQTKKKMKKRFDLAVDKLAQPSHHPGSDTKLCSSSAGMLLAVEGVLWDEPHLCWWRTSVFNGVLSNCSMHTHIKTPTWEALVGGNWQHTIIVHLISLQLPGASFWPFFHALFPFLHRSAPMLQGCQSTSVTRVFPMHACIRAFVSAATQSSTSELRMRKTELRVSQWKLMAELFLTAPLPLLQALLPSWGEISACQPKIRRKAGNAALWPEHRGALTSSPFSPSASPFQTTDKSHLKDLPFFCGWWELSDKLGTEVNTRPSPGNREFPACSGMTAEAAKVAGCVSAGVKLALDVFFKQHCHNLWINTGKTSQNSDECKRCARVKTQTL